MMSGQDAIPNLFRKKMKMNVQNTRYIPSPVYSVTSSLPLPIYIGRYMCFIPNKEVRHLLEGNAYLRPGAY